jgi:hypothetical protein
MLSYVLAAFCLTTSTVDLSAETASARMVQLEQTVVAALAASPAPGTREPGLLRVEAAAPSMGARRLSLGRSTASYAQDSVGTDFHATTPWTITAPLWVPGFSGQFVIGDLDVEGEPEDGEPPGTGIFKRLFGSNTSLEYFFVGRVRYSHDSWYGEIDSYGGRVGNSVVFLTPDFPIVSGSVRAILSRAVAGYLMMAGQGRRRGVRDVRFYFGVRHTSTRVRATFERTSLTVDKTVSWVDPLVGVDVPIVLGHKWLFRFRGDIGGFGIKSRFVWSAAADVHFRPSRLIDLGAGWNVIDVYYRGNVKDERVTLDYLLMGPQLSIGFRF